MHKIRSLLSLVAMHGRQWVGVSVPPSFVASPGTSSCPWSLSSEVAYRLLPESFQTVSSLGLQDVVFSPTPVFFCVPFPFSQCHLFLGFLFSCVSSIVFFHAAADPLPCVANDGARARLFVQWSPLAASSDSSAALLGLYHGIALLSARCCLSSLVYVQTGTGSRAIYITRVRSCTHMGCTSGLETLRVPAGYPRGEDRGAVMSWSWFRITFSVVCWGGGLNRGKFIDPIPCAVP